MQIMNFKAVTQNLEYSLQDAAFYIVNLRIVHVSLKGSFNVCCGMWEYGFDYIAFVM
jgi:hypothetical protein